jgi:hypothetical protein
MESLEKVEGPWLLVAVLCEKVIEDKGGQLSLIGIIDRIVLAVSGPDTPPQMPPFTVQLNAVVKFASGFVRGNLSVGLQPVSPSGVRGPMISGQMLFEGEDRGVHFISQVTANLTESGLYWFDVLVEGRTVSRIPLRIVYQAVSTGTVQPPPILSE